jgi:IS5 family transposase
VIDPLQQTIVCVATAAAKTHDFALFKSSRLALLPQTVLLADTGYQGVDTLHPNSWTPFKKSKLRPLTPEQKQQNRLLASCRVTVENVIRTLKRFRILSSTYRNRRKRFGLRLNLIAAIVNLHQ